MALYWSATTFSSSMCLEIGTILSKYFSGIWLRIAFVPLPVVGAGIILYSPLWGILNDKQR